MTTQKTKATANSKPAQSKTAKKDVAVEPTVAPTIEPIVEPTVDTTPTVDTNVADVAETPKRAKKLQIDHNDLIEVRSAKNNRLIYVSTRTKEVVIWSHFGASVHISMGELLTMKSSQPAFLNNMLVIVDDEEAVEYLGLKSLYEKTFKIEDLDEFFNQSAEQLREALPKLPKGLRSTVANRARALIEDDILTDLGKIRAIEDKLDVDLKLFIK